MRTIQKFSFMLLAAFLLIGVCDVFAGGQQEGVRGEGDEKVTITILHEHSYEAASNIASSYGFRAMLDKFIEEHPEVNVEETIIGNSEIQNKYSALMAANELPDVTYVRYPWLADMAGSGMLADLTDYIDPNDYMDGLFSVTYKGRVYGMPNKFSGYNLVYYNEDMFKDIGYNTFPETYEEFLKAGELFKAQDMDMIAFGNTGKWLAVSYLVSPLLYNYCGKEWVESMQMLEGKYKWTDQCFVDAMDAVAKLSKYINVDCNMQNDIWAAGWYMQGNTSAHIAGTWGLDLLKRLSADYPEVWEKTRVALLPSANGAEDTLCTAVGAAMGVSSKAEGAVFDAALALCQQISSKDYAELLADKASPTPVKIQLDFSGRGIMYEQLAEVLNETPNAGLNFNDYFHQSLSTNLQAVTQSVLAGSMSAKDAALKMQAIQDSLN